MYSWDRRFPKGHKAKPWVVQAEFSVPRPSVKHSSVYVASLPQTLRTNGSCRKKVRRGSTPEHGSVNANQLPPGTGKTVVFLISEKS